MPRCGPRYPTWQRALSHPHHLLRDCIIDIFSCNKYSRELGIPIALCSRLRFVMRMCCKHRTIPCFDSFGVIVGSPRTHVRRGNPQKLCVIRRLSNHSAYYVFTLKLPLRACLVIQVNQLLLIYLASASAARLHVRSFPCPAVW